MIKLETIISLKIKSQSKNKFFIDDVYKIISKNLDFLIIYGEIETELKR
jgi:uncharacterized alpha/beta hydrolase family protein